MSHVTFNNYNNFFFSTLNKKVEEYFRKNKINKTGNKSLYLKSIILITLALAAYITLITVDMNPFLAATICCLFGLIQAGIGFNVMHDANHGSYSKNRWVNKMMGLTANMMGVNAWMWKQKHNIIHHTYTNVDGVDDDIIKPPFLRMCPSQIQKPIHRFQHIYCIPLYSLTSFVWTFVTDFTKYFEKKIQVTKMWRMNNREHVIFWISKVLYVFFYIALPIYAVGIIPFIIGFSLMHITLGLTLAMVFQLAHIVEATHFKDASHSTLKIEDEWAIHQVRTTADFATQNKVISWFTWGLNFQIEHHLFPKISHVHYPAICKLVKETCEQFSVRHNNYPSFFAALKSHIRLMKQFGTLVPVT
jgi:linoleoyl-CoA desaturase